MNDNIPEFSHNTTYPNDICLRFNKNIGTNVPKIIIGKAGEKYDGYMSITKEYDILKLKECFLSELKSGKGIMSMVNYNPELTLISCNKCLPSLDFLYLFTNETLKCGKRTKLYRVPNPDNMPEEIYYQFIEKDKMYIELVTPLYFPKKLEFFILKELL